jgi:propanol-preferring alcohol dehydrogenase
MGEGAPCGVCRTDLRAVDGELPDPVAPITPGHEIVDRIDALAPGVEGLSIGERVGIPRLGYTYRVCSLCRSRRQNMCDSPGFTGVTFD